MNQLRTLRFAALACAVLFALALAPSVLAGDSMTGEVLDLACYENGQSGPGHAACAKRCLGRDGAMGLLVDGEVYEIDVEGSNADAVKTMREKGGENVTVMGDVAEKDGMKMLKVKSAKAA